MGLDKFEIWRVSFCRGHFFHIWGVFSTKGHFFHNWGSFFTIGGGFSTSGGQIFHFHQGAFFPQMGRFFHKGALFSQIGGAFFTKWRGIFSTFPKVKKTPFVEKTPQAERKASESTTARVLLCQSQLQCGCEATFWSTPYILHWTFRYDKNPYCNAWYFF